MTRWARKSWVITGYFRPSVSSRITDAEETSDPEPRVVGMATKRDRPPRGGREKGRLRLSASDSGHSYSAHRSLAPSRTLPPPRAMMTSGWKVSSLARSGPRPSRPGSPGQDFSRTRRSSQAMLFTRLSQVAAFLNEGLITRAARWQRKPLRAKRDWGPLTISRAVRKTGRGYLRLRMEAIIPPWVPASAVGACRRWSWAIGQWG